MYYFCNKAIFLDYVVHINIVSLKGQDGLLGKIFLYFSPVPQTQIQTHSLHFVNVSKYMKL